MKRRTFLSTTGIAGFAGLAGCSGLTSSEGDGNGNGRMSVEEFDSPSAVIEGFYNTLAETQQTRMDFRHSETLTEEDQFELQNVETETLEEGLSADAFAERVDLAQETVTTIVDGSDTAIVEATVSFLDGTEEEANSETFALATEDGNWKIVEQNVDGNSGSDGTVQPNASFSFDYVADEQTVTITHDAGNSIPAQELFVRGDRIESGYTGAWHEIEGSQYGPEEQIGAGMGIDIAVKGSGFELEVIWESQETDNSATLATMDGPDA
jgi:hypothetical protein